METLRKGVVVVGLGGFGSAALWRLAERGVDVAGIERHGIGHHPGSSHGATRLFRIACQEHPGLAAVALKSLELWTGLGEQTGQQLVRQSGCLTTGSPDSRPVRGAIAAAAAGLPVVQLSHEELAARQPQYAGLAPGDVAVWDPGAGICYPERNVRAHTEAARRLGAEVYPHTMVTGIEAGRGGAPRRAPLYWFRPRDPLSGDFTLDKFPSFIWERPDGEHLWGHGSTDDFGVKIGLHPGLATASTAIDPEEMDRYIHLDTDIDELTSSVARAFPGLEPRPAKAIPCMVTESPDEQFLVGRLAGEPRVVVAGKDDLP
jgi:sarcosine oxidase